MWLQPRGLSGSWAPSGPHCPESGTLKVEKPSEPREREDGQAEEERLAWLRWAQGRMRDSHLLRLSRKGPRSPDLPPLVTPWSWEGEVGVCALQHERRLVAVCTAVCGHPEVGHDERVSSAPIRHHSQQPIIGAGGNLGLLGGVQR